ncbi:MAG: NAD-dependent epimerase/dehydratase family protein, partial [Chlorobi bacterium]|nr:NAD-dependent epimerase/dehydratase family protein [Chlorobiota bacterium]
IEPVSPTFITFVSMIMVTGGTGFVGAHLLYHLTKEGKQVSALKRPGSDTKLTSKIFSFYSENSEDRFKLVQWVEGDILDYYSLTDAFEGITQLYHAAAMVSFHSGDKDKVIRVNSTGTANVVNAALEKNIEKMCYVSSVGVL